MSHGHDLPFDCRSCGLCCRGRSGTVLVTEQDLTRFQRGGRLDLVESLVPGHFGLQGLGVRADGHCTHQGTAQNPNDCSIYAIRPQACRDFEAGGAECLAVRRRGGRE